MVRSIDKVSEAHEELQKIGGLPVEVRAESASWRDGKLIRVAKTVEEFEAAIEMAIQKSYVKSCYIHRSPD